MATIDISARILGDKELSAARRKERQQSKAMVQQFIYGLDRSYP